MAATREAIRQCTMASAAGAPFRVAWGAGMVRTPTAAPRASRSRVSLTFGTIAPSVCACNSCLRSSRCSRSTPLLDETGTVHLDRGVIPFTT